MAEYRQFNKQFNFPEQLHDFCSFEQIVEACNGGMLIIDTNCNIVWASKTYLLMIGKDESIFGNNLYELRGPEAKLCQVVETGFPQKAEIRNFGGNAVVVSRFPLYQNNKLVGAVATILFWSPDEAEKIYINIKEMSQSILGTKGKASHSSKLSFNDIITKNQALIDLKTLAKKAAFTNSTILLRGETGTGKEMFAHAIHSASPRRNGPFIIVNLAAVPEQLIEAELFGYEEGSFTGAKKGGKAGKLELADGGTLFLDEIGDMPASTQVKLLRFLQFKEFERVGGNQPQQVNVRFITATHKDLNKMVEEGVFREDLFYRINVVPIHLPALRDRPEDIPLLAEYLLKKLNKELGTNVSGITEAAKQSLQKYSWPGNIRQLENVIERAINFSSCGVIDIDNITIYHDHKQPFTGKEIESSISSIEELERSQVLQALQNANGNKSKAASILGLSRSGLYKKMDRLKINY